MRDRVRYLDSATLRGRLTASPTGCAIHGEELRCHVETPARTPMALRLNGLRQPVGQRVKGHAVDETTEVSGPRLSRTFEH